MDFNSVSDRGILRLVKALQEEAVETEKTHLKVSSRWRNPDHESRFFRFNVEQGLAEVRLAEFDKQDEIQAGTIAYLQRHDTQDKLQRCVEHLRLRKCT